MCEFCPTCGDGYCSVCSGKRFVHEPFAFRYLHNVGYDASKRGNPLSKCIADLQAEYGALGRTDLENVIQGWLAGSAAASSPI